MLNSLPRALGIWLLLAVPALLLLAFSGSQSYQNKSFAKERDAISQQVAQNIISLGNTLESMVSIHTVTSGDKSALIAMAEQLRRDNPKITAVGRFKNIPLLNRNEFETNMRMTGLYDSDIANLTVNGRISAAPREYARPVSLLEPMKPALLPLLGSDLAAEPTLRASIAAADAKDENVLIAIPDHWPAAGQLMMLRPAYKGSSTPDNAEARLRQIDGGYFLIINPEAYLDGVLDQKSFSRVNALSLSIQKQEQKTLLANRQYPTEELMGANWLAPSRLQYIFDIGDASLLFSASVPRGLPTSHFVMAMSLITLSSVIYLLFLSRHQERQRFTTEKKISHDALRKERDRTARTLHLINDSVITVNHQGIIQHVNKVGEQFLKGSSKQLLDKPLDDFLTLRYRDQPANKMNVLQLLKNMSSGELVVLDLDSDSSNSQNSTYRCTVSLNKNSSEGQGTAVFVIRDTSSQTQLTEALEYQATHDALTQCVNRYYFELWIEGLKQNTKEHSAGSALLYIDLDQFKIVNDSAGHTSGDNLLIQVTKELRRIESPKCTLARLGGDEFGMLMNDVCPSEAKQIALWVYERFQSMVFYDQRRSYPIRASLGLVHSNEVDDSPYDVLTAADLACYAAKDLGRNTLYVFEADDAALTLRTKEMQWLPLLRQALQENRFRLDAQPLVLTDAPDTCVRYELLLRLQDEHGNEMQTASVVDAAERFSMMREIDRWVIDHALCAISRHDLDSGSNKKNFAINLSGQSAADSTLIDYISERIEFYKVAPERLCFELTETAAISHFANAVDLSQAIRNMGAKIALDDFGSGLSSFAYLKNLPVDILKIDGHFIRDIATDHVDAAMVKAIQDMANSMQITVAAEYVESQAILDVLTDIGIDMAQGFHIGKPIPMSEALA